MFIVAVPPGASGQPAGPPAFQQAELDQLLAPIALYPDSLLAQIFMASTYPLEVVQADRWAKQNKSLKGDALTAALEQQPWDPSVKSLVNFAQVLGMMSEKLDWTQKLGDAFLAQQKDVMDSVQRLRRQAMEAGSLKTTPEQQVIVEKETIVIQAASPQVVYVPTYNPTVVYGTWAYPSYPPAYYYPPGYAAGTALLSFGAGMAVGAAWGYAWGHCNWNGGDVDVDVNRNTNINNNINRGNYQRGQGAGTGVVAAQPRAPQGGLLPRPGHGPEVQPGVHQRRRAVQGELPRACGRGPAGPRPRRLRSARGAAGRRPARRFRGAGPKPGRRPPGTPRGNGATPFRA